MPDSAPQKGNGRARPGERVGRMGIRNEDGREDGGKWDNSDPLASRKAWGIDFNDKNVGVEPNEGIEGKLLAQGSKGLGEVVEKSSHE